MNPTHPQDRAHAARTIPTDLDLTLEARANAWGLPAEDRAAILRTAELLGCHVAAARIREAARRRERVHAAPPPAPRPGPKPKPTPPRPPILVALSGEGRSLSPDEARREHFLQTARLAEQGARAGWATPNEAAALLRSAARCRAAARER